MKAKRQFTTAALCLSACFALASGCARRATANDAEASETPKIEGDKIQFATNAPQLGFLATEPVQERNAVTTGLNGRLAWDDDVTARVYPSVSGRIVTILAKPSQRVAVGDVLAKIKSPDFGQAQADARKAIADLKVAERALARTRDLIEHGAASQKDVETAEADYTRALSEKDRALATLGRYESDGSTADVDGVFSLKAPVGGVIVEKSVNPGQEVRADQVGDKPLFVITDPTQLWVLLDATEQDLSSLRPGTEVKLRSQTYADQTFPAHIEVISDFIDPNSRTIKVRGTVDNSQRLLKAEMFVTAELPAPLQVGVNVPASAVFLKGDRHYVFVESAKGTYQRQEVQVGQEQPKDVLVTNDLKPGQSVVTDGGLLLNQLLAEGPSEPITQNGFRQP